MTSAMTAFWIGAGGLSLIIFLMSQSGGRGRGSPGSSGSDSGNYSGGDGWGLASWFGSGHLESDNSCSSSYGGDSGGGGGDCSGDF